MEYIKNLILIFITVNLVIAFTPVWIKKPIKILAIVTYKLTKFTYTQSRRLLIFSYNNLACFYKYVAKRVKSTTKAPEQDDNVIDFTTYKKHSAK